MEHEADRVLGRVLAMTPGAPAGFGPTTTEKPLPAEISRQINRPNSVATSLNRLERESSGHDLSDVPVHQDAARDSPGRSLQTDQIVSGSMDGRALAADQAAKVVAGTLPQATATPNTANFSPRQPVIQRGAANRTAAATADASESRTEASPSVDAAVPGLIVEDDAAQVGSGQMKKSSFLSQVRIEVRGAADAILAASGRSTKGCPHLKFWLDYYSRRDGRYIEQAIRRYAPEAARVGAARDYIGFIVDRVIRAVTVWTAAGEATGEPATLPAAMPLAAAVGAAAPLETGGLQHGERNGGATPGALQAIQSQLGTGTPLDTGVRSRMESAFGYDFSRVRIHADESMAGNLNSRAFAIGKDIAFGIGEYAPGTFIGDALIAHELAHVVQQGEGIGSGEKQEGESGGVALEEDANVSAIRVMASALGGMKNTLKAFGEKAMPAMRSGLRLQSCAAAAAPAVPLVGGAVSTGITELLAAVGLVTLTTIESDTPGTQSEMGQHGKGNVADTGVVSEAQAIIAAGAATEICAALEILMEAARRAGDKAKMLKIKATQKAFNCRRHRD